MSMGIQLADFFCLSHCLASIGLGLGRSFVPASAVNFLSIWSTIVRFDTQSGVSRSESPVECRLCSLFRGP